MIIYNIFRFFLWLMYICFFRRVYTLNYNLIPPKDPVIFISNHSNGFMDPILIAALQWRPVYFWARASELPDNPKGWLFRKLHGLPIHREVEGKEDMHKNEATFQKTRDLLYNGSTVFIAPEGNCFLEKRLRPFKTGGARLAFKMMEEKNWGIDVKIVPSGVNYTYPNKFRSEVYVKIGEPISVQDYKADYEKDSVAAVNKLTADMWNALRAQMIHVETEDEVLTEKVLKMVRNNFKRGILPMYSKDDTVFNAEQKAATIISKMQQQEKNDFHQQIDAYYQLLADKKINDYAVAEKNTRSLLMLLLGFPFWLAGTVSGKIPHVIAQALRNKIAPIDVFSTSITFSAAFLIWIFWSLLVIIGAAFFIKGWALLLPFVMAPLQMQAYHYEDYYTEWKALLDYNKIKDKELLRKARAGVNLKI